MNKPTENEIDEVLNTCSSQEDEGGSAFPGMTYEQGVLETIKWIRGEGSNPLDE